MIVARVGVEPGMGSGQENIGRLIVSLLQQTESFVERQKRSGNRVESKNNEKERSSRLFK